MNIFTPEHLQKVQMHFIGSGRSGTTLLTQIFNAHSQVLSTPETKAFEHFLNYANSKVSPNNQSLEMSHEIIKFDELYKEFTKYRLKPWTFDGNALSTYLKESQPNYDYASFLKAFFLCFRFGNASSNEHVLFIIDKEPRNTDYAESIIRFFPNSRFIITQRDYRAVLNSHKQSPDKRGLPESQLSNWKDKQQTIHHLLQTYPDKMMLINYEKLIEQPDVIIPAMCTFLGIPYEPSMLEHHKQDILISINLDNSKADERDKTKWGAIKKPINNSRMYKWRSELTRDEIIVAERICGEIGKTFGYMPEANASALEVCKTLIKRLPYYIVGIILNFFFKKIYDKSPMSWRRSIREKYLLYRLKKSNKALDAL